VEVFEIGFVQGVPDDLDVEIVEVLRGEAVAEVRCCGVSEVQARRGAGKARRSDVSWKIGVDQVFASPVQGSFEKEHVECGGRGFEGMCDF
jgi:hypothetical protein